VPEDWVVADEECVTLRDGIATVRFHSREPNETSSLLHGFDITYECDDPKATWHLRHFDPRRTTLAEEIDAWLTAGR